MEKETYQHLVKYLSELVVPLEFDHTRIRKLKSQARNYIVHEGILYKKKNNNNIKGDSQILKESRVMARTNILKSQGKQKLIHDRKYHLLISLLEAKSGVIGQNSMLEKEASWQKRNGVKPQRESYGLISQWGKKDCCKNVEESASTLYYPGGGICT
ncbi:hypothetical protein C2G38_2041713 [Gigaspora rosea]|uniref:Uncharacterized protein n=1 Tax=Gigaspora rosea TaxID=44941 RepID=A0A397UQT6_9GLOM|nr:hypothetical protein C2G38_2041713 [Gigaspora rosea]